METLGLVSYLDDRKESSVRHISTTPENGGGDGSTPVEGGGSGSQISQQIKSTPATDRHRSAAPNGGVDGGGNSGGGSTRGSSSEVLSRNKEYK